MNVIHFLPPLPWPRMSTAHPKGFFLEYKKPQSPILFSFFQARPEMFSNLCIFHNQAESQKVQKSYSLCFHK